LVEKKETAVLLDPILRAQIAAWVAEDVGRGDRTTQAVIPAGAVGRARIEAREAAVVAGLDAAVACFDAAGGGVDLEVVAGDGSRVEASATIARLDGSLRSILTGERTALNLLARISGVATLTARYVAAVADRPVRIVDTRKTTPGLRALQKYAVRVGGGSNHRYGLDDGILLKDNHIAAVGSITEAVRRARAEVPHGLRIEVEVTTLEELDEATSAGADAVLLDNLSVATTAQAVARAGGKVVLESSGGITLHNVAAYAAAGVDLISIGALTHGAPSIDLALEMEKS
jgi:nicotinate-nucleotide pyrophosphorylase (carboxylating)